MPRWFGGCATAARASAAMASSGWCAARTCPTPPPSWGRTSDSASGSWTTATPTARTPKSVRQRHPAVPARPRQRGAARPGHLRVRCPGGHARRPTPRGRHPGRRLLGRHGAGPPFGEGTADRVGPGPSPAGPSRWATRTWPVSPTSPVEVPRPPRRPPTSTPPLFPEVVNVELINVVVPGGHIRLRVFERGRGGDPLVRHRRLRGRLRGPRRRWTADGTVLVDVPGGRLSVQISSSTTALTGPAVIVSVGVLCPEWLGD